MLLRLGQPETQSPVPSTGSKRTPTQKACGQEGKHGKPKQAALSLSDSAVAASKKHKVISVNYPIPLLRCHSEHFNIVNLPIFSFTLSL